MSQPEIGLQGSLKKTRRRRAFPAEREAAEPGRGGQARGQVSQPGGQGEQSGEPRCHAEGLRVTQAHNGRPYAGECHMGLLVLGRECWQQCAGWGRARNC